MRLVLTLHQDNQMVMKNPDGTTVTVRLSSRQNSSGHVRVCIDAPEQVRISREDVRWEQPRKAR